MSENIEIERRFLLTDIPDINYKAIIRITQNYKSDFPERIRKEELFLKPKKPFFNFFLNKEPVLRFEHTKKTPIQEGVVEHNQSISESDYNNLIKKFPCSIKKIRHIKPCTLNTGLIWEIDDFSCHNTESPKLVIAEIEVPSLNYKVKIPKWLERKIVKEITGEDCFSNFSLSKLEK